MKNVDLNAGGLFGALACGGAVLGSAIALSDDPSDMRISKLFVMAVVGGALVGNFVWARIFPK
jgi:hypothetical protein